jgi:hypothetical protein
MNKDLEQMAQCAREDVVPMTQDFLQAKVELDSTAYPVPFRNFGVAYRPQLRIPLIGAKHKGTVLIVERFLHRGPLLNI